MPGSYLYAQYGLSKALVCAHGMDPKLVWSLFFSICSIFVPSFPLDRNNSELKFLMMGTWSPTSTGDYVYLLEVVSSSTISPLLDILG